MTREAKYEEKLWLNMSGGVDCGWVLRRCEDCLTTEFKIKTTCTAIPLRKY
jgi:hypothetical protein